MKKEKDILINLPEIADYKSPFYCGSAIYLRMIPFIQMMERERPRGEEFYPQGQKTLLSLYRQDSSVFARTKEKDGKKIPWNSLGLYYRDEADFLSRLRNRIEVLPFSFRSEARNQILVSCFDTLAGQAKESLSVFFDFDEAESLFKAAGVSLLRECEGKLVPLPAIQNPLLSPEEKKTMALCSLVPIALLKKLILRKNLGKNPFSPSLHVEDIVQNLDSYIQKETRSREERKEASSYALSASKEIKNPSFRNDFLWVWTVLAGFSEIL